MKIDLGSFAFGSDVSSGGNTPSWGTSLGQIKPDLKLTYPGYDNIVIGMVYKSIPVDKVYIPLGKGGHICNSLEDEGIQLAALFEKVYINEVRVNAPFIMLIYKEDSNSWPGRKTLKYNTKIEYRRGNNDIVYNSDFVIAAREALQLADDACWVISDLFILDQDELHMVAGVINPYHSETYPTSELRKAAFINAIKTTYEENPHFKQLYGVNDSDDSDNKIKALQQIFYGAPGTGKSNTIKTEVDEKGLPCVRTTFHPDSDYSTFVGAYKPTMVKEKRYGLNQKETVVLKDPDNGNKPLEEHRIEYKFVKQAFLKAYINAWKLYKDTCIDGNEPQPQFLVIEEINRGNCAQIFGDLFQLLDRKKGFSEYPIEADEDVRKSLLNTDTDDDPCFGEKGLQLSDEQKSSINSIFDKSGFPSQNVAQKICEGKVLVLPCNLYIWATMNTSDQSLFPIDSAFKRRWDWVYMPIDTAKEMWYIKIGETYYSWTKFLDKVNDELLTEETAEDKHLGFYFCKATEKKDGTGNYSNVITAKTFVGKVLFYLWNDVFKVYGIPSSIGNSKDWPYRKFYQTSGEVNEQKVIELMKKLNIAPEGNNESKTEDVENQ